LPVNEGVLINTDDGILLVEVGVAALEELGIGARGQQGPEERPLFFF